MDTVKTIIYSACIVGVVSSMLEIASPEGTMKKQLDLVLGLVLVMVVITPFMNSDFKFRLNDYTVSYDKKIYEDIKDYENSLVFDNARKELSEYFQKKLSENGIECKDVIITLDIDEYNQIEVTKVQVCSIQQDKQQISKLILSELPKTQVEVIEGETS